MCRTIFLLTLVILSVVLPIDISPHPFLDICIDPLIAGSLITGGLGLVGNTMNGIAAQADRKEQRAWNWLSMMQQYFNQSKLNQQQNDFQRSLLGAMQKYQSDEWTRQFNMENAYNSPVAQAARLRNAGFNPSVLLGNGGLGSASAHTSPVSSPSGSPVGSGSAAMAAPVESESQLLSSRGMYIRDLTNSLATIFKAPFEAKEKDAAASLSYQQIAESISDENLKKSMTHAQNIENMCNEKWLDKKTAADVRLINKEIDLAVLKGDNISADTAIKKVEKLLNGESLFKAITENRFLLQEIKARLNLLEEQAKTEKAKQTESFASAEEHRAGASLKSTQKEIEDIRLETDRALKTSRIETLAKQYEAEYLHGEALSEQNKLLRDRIYSLRQLRNSSEKDKVADDILYYISRELGLHGGVSGSVSVSTKE